VTGLTPQARGNDGRTGSLIETVSTVVAGARASNLAGTQAEIDVATFTQWVDAYSRKEADLADFYRRRFRAEFRPAVDAWIATRPLVNPNAPLTPFAMPEYRLQADNGAAALGEQPVTWSHHRPCPGSLRACSQPSCRQHQSAGPDP